MEKLYYTAKEVAEMLGVSVSHAYKVIREANRELFSKNPVKKAGTIVKGKADEMDFWTKEEYLKFIECVKDKPISYYAFQILYWCGIREGELLALTPTDVDFENKKLHITKSYQFINGEDIITDPKTEKSRRDVVIPDFLVEELRQFIGMLYGYGRDDRIFQITKSYLHHEMSRGAKAAGVKRIRIHDLRHPYVKPTTKKFITFFEAFRAAI